MELSHDQATIKSEVIHLRVSKQLKQMAFWAAAEDSRSLSNYIITLIRDDLKAKERAA